jgi:tetratricopeptide (TPR) repeat protein
MTELSTRDVARILEVPEAKLRYWAQTGFIGPSVRRDGRFFYAFVDLIALRTAKELIASGLALQTVRKHLDALRAQLPSVAQPLASLRVCSDGETLVVLADGGAYEPASGQLVMSFAVADLVREEDAPPIPIAAPPTNHDPVSAYACFTLALAREEQDRAAAERLYRRAIALDDRFAAAWTNLGALLDRRGARGEARDCFERALACDPDQPEAHHNLAVLADELGDEPLATAHYRRAVR